MSSNPPKTWQPSHGIVFKDVSAPGSPRLLSTTSIADNEHDLAYESFIEESVLASSFVKHSKTSEVAKVAFDEVLESSEMTEDVPQAVDVREEKEDIEEEARRAKIPISHSTYQMSEESFRTAKKAKPETPESYWSHTLYRGPLENGVPKKVKVHYCRSLQTTERTLQQYFLGKKVLGFDIEWKADARKTSPAKLNVSLIQLATEERVGLFHIALYPTSKVSELVAPSMRKIMEDPEVTKVGVAISADCTRLRNYLGVDSASILELSNLHKLVKYTLTQEPDQINKRMVALATQVQEHLHLPLFKGGNVRSSDWSRPLSIKQISYAASDSYAGFQLYNILEQKRQALNPVPPRPSHIERPAVKQNSPQITITKPVPSKSTSPKSIPSKSNSPIATSSSPTITTTQKREPGTSRRDPTPDSLSLASETTPEHPNTPAEIASEVVMGSAIETTTEEKTSTQDLDTKVGVPLKTAMKTVCGLKVAASIPTQEFSPLDFKSSVGNLDNTLGMSLKDALKAASERKIEEETTTPDSSIELSFPLQSTTANDEASLDMNEAEAEVESPASSPSSILLASDILAALHLDAKPLSQIDCKDLAIYFIWYHNPTLPISTITRLVWKSGSSIASKKTHMAILKTVQGEDLPFETERLKAVLGGVPKDVAWTRWRRLVEKVGF